MMVVYREMVSPNTGTQTRRLPIAARQRRPTQHFVSPSIKMWAETS